MKTPVSLLQEYLVEQNEQLPIYITSEVLDETRNKKVFSCQLSLYGGAYVASGSGYSKKDAKQDTARNMLIKLSEDRSIVKKLLEKHSIFNKSKPVCLQPVSCPKSKDVSSSLPNPVNKIQSSDSHASKNMSNQNKYQSEKSSSVQVLEELLAKVNLIPYFTFDDTSSSTKQSCKLELFGGLLHVKSQGKNKDEAKNKAAQNMLEQLLEQQSVIEKYIENEKDDIDEVKMNSKTQEKNNSTKTPVALLQEYLVANEYVMPRYECSEPIIHSSTSRPWFRCKLDLTLDKKFHAEATGLTKRQAKHKTAEKILTQLSHERSDVKELLRANNFLDQDEDQMEIEKSTSVASSEENLLQLKEDESKIECSSSLEVSTKQENKTKTPVSILHEFLALEGSRPIYIESELPKALSAKKFHCKLKLYDGKFCSEATAKNKKLAKHETAREMLLTLSKHKPELKNLLDRNDLDQFMNKISCNQRDSVGQLLKYCSCQNFKCPEYTFIEETGEPHDRTFKMSCKVEYIVVEGTGPRISAAKRDSAAKMIIRLQEELKKIEESEKSGCSEVQYSELALTDVDYYSVVDKDKQYKNSIEVNRAPVSIATNDIEDESREEDVNVNNNSSEVKCVQVESDSIKYKLLNTGNVNTYSSEVKCVQVESDSIKYKLLNTGKASLQDVKSLIAKQHKFLREKDLNITDALNQIRLKKGLFDSSNKAWFEYLDQTHVEDLCSIVDILKGDKDVTIDVTTRDQTISGQEFCTTCKLRVKGLPINFVTCDSKKEESVRKVYVALLNYLSSQK